MASRVYFLIVIISSMLASAKSDASVYTRSAYGLSLTSSTLRWISVDGSNFDGMNLPKDIIEAGQEGSASTYVCRAYHSGISLLGSSDGSICSIVFYDVVHSYSLFEVLVNAGGAGRVVWKPWSRSTSIPLGTVENYGHYVARHADVNGNIYVGRLDSTSHRGKVFVAQESTAREYLSSEILVEVEAVKYEIDQLVPLMAKKKVLSSALVPLADTTLENQEDPEDSLVSTVLSFEASHSVYLPVADISGVNRILPASITIPDVSESVPLVWGQTALSTVTKLYDVSYKLAYGTGIKVAINGHRVTFQAPYTATMKTIYADNETLSRRIEGFAKQTMIMDIQAIFGEPYFINNGSVVPTTTSTTTTTTTTIPTTIIPTDVTTNYVLNTMTDAGFSGDQRDQPIDEPESSSSSSASFQTSAKKVKSTEAAWIQNSPGGSSTISANILLFLITFLITR